MFAIRFALHASASVCSVALLATLISIATPSHARTAETCGSNYTVRSGDTLGRIARRCGTTVKDIMKAMPELNPSRLRIGQEIIIPNGAVSAAKSEETAKIDGTTTDAAAIATTPETVLKGCDRHRPLLRAAAHR